MGQSKYQYDLDLRTFYDVMVVLDSQVYKSELVKHNLQKSIEEGVCLYIEGKTVDPLKDNVKAIADDIDRYIESLNFLKAKLNEYHDNMANTFSIKDVNRAIYLDVLGLDEWLKALKNYFGIDSDEVNAVVNDSGVFQEFIYNTQKEITAKAQLYSDGFISDMIQGDRAIELEFRKEAQRYRDAKKKYEESSNIVRKKIKFEDELDEIIENISKAKGINDIEDAFSVESIREVLAQIRDGNYKGIGDIKVDSYSVISPDEANSKLHYKVLYIEENFKFMNYGEERVGDKITIEFDGREYTFIINDDRISLPFGVFINYNGKNIFVHYKNYDSMPQEIKDIIDNEYGGLNGLTEMARYYEDGESCEIFVSNVLIPYLRDAYPESYPSDMSNDEIADAISGQTSVQGLVNEFEAHADMLNQENNVTSIYNIFHGGYRTEEDIEHSLGIADVAPDDENWDAKIMGHWPL